MPLHPTATRGFSLAVDAYDRSRPDYPPAAVDAVLAALALSPRDPLLELGAGTGKLTRLLAARGARVVALEPIPAMRARLRGVPDVSPVAAVAEALPIHPGVLGGAIAATAFHWFDGARTLAELHRALRPRGRLALLWNVRDESVDWIARLGVILRAAEHGGAPRYRTGAWRAAFDAPGSGFGPLAEARFEHVHPLSPEGVVERIASVSFVAARPEAERAPVLDAVRALLASHPDTAGRDVLPLRYRTDVFWCERRS